MASITARKNDVTNIGKASDLYLLSDKAPLLSIPVYVEGIGTAKGQDDTKAGAGADKGETSSTSRVEQACRTQIVAKIKEQLSEIQSSIECIHKVEFDVFGFSRGLSRPPVCQPHRPEGDHPLVEAMTTAPISPESGL